MASASIALAAPIPNPTAISDVGGIFTTIFLFLIGIIGGIAIIFIVIGGIRYILAQGDPKSTDAAKNQITAALIGLVIALLAVLVVIIVGNLLGTGTRGLDLINPQTKPTIVP